MPRIKSLIPAIDESDMRQCRALFFGGFSAADISRDTGINVNTIFDWAKKGGWHDERKAIVAAQLKRKPPDQAPVAKMLSAKKASFVERFVAKTGKIAAEDAEYWDEEMDPISRLEHAPNIAAIGKFHRSNLGLEKEETGERGHISLTFLGNPDAVRLISNVQPKQIEEQPVSAPEQLEEAT